MVLAATAGCGLLMFALADAFDTIVPARRAPPYSVSDPFSEQHK